MATRILLVEDNLATRDVMWEELKLLGYEVKVARNGVEGVEMVASESPDLILMDILMPKMDGFEATSKIKKDPKTRGIPILAVTARSLPEDKEKCIAAGCDDYLAKPFTHVLLDTAIRNLLKKQSKGT